MGAPGARTNPEGERAYGRTDWRAPAAATDPVVHTVTTTYGCDMLTPCLRPAHYGLASDRCAASTFSMRLDDSAKWALE